MLLDGISYQCLTVLDRLNGYLLLCVGLQPWDARDDREGQDDGKVLSSQVSFAYPMLDLPNRLKDLFEMLVNPLPLHGCIFTVSIIHSCSVTSLNIRG